MVPICSIDGCGSRHEAHGLCAHHYYEWRRDGRPPLPPTVVKCVTCSVVMQGASKNRRYCDACAPAHQASRSRRYRLKPEGLAQRRAWQAANREKVRAYVKAWQQRNPGWHYKYRRQFSKDARSEAIHPKDVFERDGWKCQLCGRKLKRDAPWGHPKEPTIDHIVPVSRGGAHVLANVQAAHRACNLVKGNRVFGPAEQLRLIG